MRLTIHCEDCWKYRVRIDGKERLCVAADDETGEALVLVHGPDGSRKRVHEMTDPEYVTHGQLLAGWGLSVGDAPWAVELVRGQVEFEMSA